MPVIDEDGTALYLAAAEVYNLVSALYGLGVEIPPSIPIWLHYTWGGAGTQIEAARKALAGISGPTAVIAGLANFLMFLEEIALEHSLIVARTPTTSRVPKKSEPVENFSRQR